MMKLSSPPSSQRLGGATIDFKQTIWRGDVQLIDATHARRLSRFRHVEAARHPQGSVHGVAQCPMICRFGHWCSMRAPSCRRWWLLLMIASVASWAIIFRKSRVISQSRRQADQFETAVLVGRRSGRAVSQHRDQGPRGHRPAEHLRVRFRRIQPPAPAGDAVGPAARGRAARDAGRADARNRPSGAQSGDAGHGRFDQSVRGPVRHGLGHHERLPQSRQRAAGDAGGGGAGHRRGA